MCVFVLAQQWQRVLGNTLVIGLIVFMGYMIVYFTKTIPSVDTSFGTVRPTSFLVSAFNFVLPTLFWYIGMMEMYLTDLEAVRLYFIIIIILIEKKIFFSQTRVHLIRSYVVKMVSLYVLLISYMAYIAEGDNKMPWETNIGEDFYNLVWINGIRTCKQTSNYFKK